MSTPTPPSLRPGTPIRRFPNVLRRELADRDYVRLVVGEVLELVDSQHVLVSIGDPAEDIESATQLKVPKLSSYATPVIGEPCYLLVSAYWTLAIGTVT